MLDEPTFWKAVFDHAWAGIMALMGIVWKLLDGRISDIEKQGKERVQTLALEHGKRMDGISVETNKNREVAAKIFDKLDTMSKDSAERHERILIALHTGLAGKADK
jgi:hypothetical protein